MDFFWIMKEYEVAGFRRIFTEAFPLFQAPLGAL